MSPSPVSQTTAGLGGAATTAAFDDALTAESCWLHLDGVERRELPARRWRGQPDREDEWMLSRCRGSTLDVGCGPGRLTAALSARGTAALGIDTSGVAVRMTARRGAPVRHQSVFDRVPDEGSWRHVLLADGNLGIGGDPLVLLRRVRQLLAPDGSAVVEAEPPGTGLRTGRACIGTGPSFPWSLIAADAVASLADRAGFALWWSTSQQGRWFLELGRV